MTSKLSNGNNEAVGNLRNNYLRRSSTMDPMPRIVNIQTLNPGNGPIGPPLSSAYKQQYTPNYNVNSNQPPPLPRRDDAYTNRSYSGINGYSGYGGYSALGGYSGMNSLYSPYGSRRYGPGLYSSGLYSPYSSYRSPYGLYGASNDQYNSFLQMAEESTRPAFESIESVVQVVNSISMMLESTYGAVHSSYSAILGVVSQFSHLKNHLAEIFSVLTMLKGLQWLCLKVLYLLGLRKTNPSVEEAWKTARKAAITGEYPTESSGSAWPFFMFLTLVIGAPWLMFKLLSKTTKKFDPKMWVSPDGKRYVVNAAYDFNATRPGELSFRAGEKLTLCPRNFNRRGGWHLACNEKNDTGLVPLNYMRTNARQRNVPDQSQSLVPFYDEQYQNFDPDVPLQSPRFPQNFQTNNDFPQELPNNIQDMAPSKPISNTSAITEVPLQTSVNSIKDNSIEKTVLPVQNMNPSEKDSSPLEKQNLTEESESKMND